MESFSAESVQDHKRGDCYCRYDDPTHGGVFAVATSNAGLTYSFEIRKGTRGYYVSTRDNRVVIDYGPYATTDVAKEARDYIVSHLRTFGAFPKAKR